MKDTSKQATSEHPKKLSVIKRLLVTATWAVVWPLVMFGMCIPIFSFASWIAGEPMQLGTYLGIVCVGLVGASILFIKLLKRKRQSHPVLAIGASILAIYTTIGSGILIVIVFGLLNSLTQDKVVASNPDDRVSDSIVAPTLAHEPTIDATLRSIGATDTELSKFGTAYVDTYPGGLDNQRGQYQTYLNPTNGKYLYGQMTILRSTETQDLPRVVAHEYLHHIWYSVLDESTKVKLTSDLISLYGNDSGIRNRTTAYVDSQKLQATELFSFYCTESTDGYMTTYVRSECDKYINRSAFLMRR